MVSQSFPSEHQARRSLSSLYRQIEVQRLIELLRFILDINVTARNSIRR